MRDNEPGPLKQKRLREVGHEADDEESDARSYPNLKKSRRYVIVLDSESESGELEDDKDKDPNYVPGGGKNKDEGYPFQESGEGLCGGCLSFCGGGARKHGVELGGGREALGRGVLSV